MSGPIEQAFIALRPASGFRVLLVDPPWTYSARSPLGLTKSAQKHYECQDIDWIKALPVETLAAKNCAMFLWCTWPLMPEWCDVIKAWGFEFAGLAWEWIKYNAETEKYAFGGGYGTRKNLEPCLLCTRGDPSLLEDLQFFGEVFNSNSRSVRDFIEWNPYDALRSARREHSRKPDEQYDRIEQMFAGPYVELFSRSQRQGWKSWGNETGKFDG